MYMPTGLTRLKPMNIARELIRYRLPTSEAESRLVKALTMIRVMNIWTSLPMDMIKKCLSTHHLMNDRVCKGICRE